MPASAKISTSKTHLQKAVEWLLNMQFDEGYWNAQLETNCCMEAQWLLALKFCGIESHNTVEGVKNYILNSQRPDGSWDVYRDAENGDINTTLECYAALRYFGVSKEEPFMLRARGWLVRHEWQKHIRVFTKYWLALFGEWDWKNTPELPVEIIFLPKWFPLSIYNFASWARGTMMPLTIVLSMKPVHEMPGELRLDELYPEGRESVDYSISKGGVKLFSWKKFFLCADRFLRFYSTFADRLPLRRLAKKVAISWIMNHQDEDGYWGGIQPPWIYSIVAMQTLGYPHSQINMAKALNAVNLHWSEFTERGTRIKACESPVWDTMLALNALMEAGLDDSNPKVGKAVDYLLAHENRYYGDWSKKAGKNVEPSGWAFERANAFYPDIDDTGVAIVALRKYRAKISSQNPRRKKIDEALRRAVKWVLAMQSKNGGWGAFDKDNTKQIVTKIPFCDFGEVLDPPSADVTAHVIEALFCCGYTRRNPAVKRALDFIFSEQEDDGSWFGRWGINYIYGTWSVLTALAAAGFGADDPRVKKSLAWIVSRQNEDGGWGETAATYMSPKQRGESTASQTAWALVSLMSFKDCGYESQIEKGIEYLKRAQTPDGTWVENCYTGTGFPGYGLGAKLDLRNGKPLPQGKELSRGFMLRYEFYKQYFPIVALSRHGNFSK